MSENALHSLYGEGHVNATRTRECVAMPGKREQSILSPQCIADGLERMWGPKGVSMDPCSSTNQLISAAYIPRNGLDVKWPARTYCNPPYGELRKWLEHGAEFDEVIWLAPVRTHRKWFRPWWNGLSVRLALNPLKFVGWDSAYPAPLVLGYRGVERIRFLDSFGHLGGVV